MIKAGMVNRAKLDFLRGVHQPNDDYRIALYSDRADLGPDTAKYTYAEEVRAPGYNGGGARLTGYKTGMIDGVAYIHFDPVEWDNSTIKAAGALIYNATKGDAAIVALNFGATKESSVGLFKIQFPEPSKNGAVIWIGGGQ
jgi:hypothetical protein